ncbi:AAA family ATPase [Pseudomonas putida]|nr:AAA family ATPase [Pseudomonas putida]
MSLEQVFDSLSKPVMQASPLIASISVKGLFGLYNYDLPASGLFSNAAILYGDNGVGKSTLLRLVFHLLSPGPRNGHRQALYDAEFDELSAALANGVTVRAKRQLTRNRLASGEHLKKLVLTVERDTAILALWEFVPRNHRADTTDYYYHDSDSGLVVRSTKKSIADRYKIAGELIGEGPFLSKLSSFVPNIFILNADRRLDSDAVADPGDEVELRRFMRMDEPKRLNDIVTRSRQIALMQALSSASKWISRKAIHSANRGSENVHTVYTNVIKQLTSANSSPLEDTDFTELQNQLSGIEHKTNELSRYELATPLNTLELKKSLNARSKSKKRIAAELLVPYIESLHSRLAALDPIYQLIEKFVTTINENYLRDKYITYKVSQGFSIYSAKNEPLDARHLSSGEQQLMLLFCYVLSGRDKPCVFMIDEPEISLNVKWQRQLVQSLLDITKESRIQFIFASHSMELLAQHRDRVVPMQSRAQ